jgi:hypothetical protein
MTLGNLKNLRSTRRQPRARWLTALSSALALVVAPLAMTIASQGCTVLTSDGVLDGGGFTGNDAAPLDGQAPYSSCNECLFQGCVGQWAVCQNNAECMAIYICSTAPSCAANGACVDACFAAHPTGQSAYYSLASCDQYGQCGTCAATCGGAPASCPVTPPADAGTPPPDAEPLDAGTPPVDAGAVQSCTDCTTSQCGAEKSACATGSSCDLYTQCLAACADVPCIDTCGTNNPDGKAASGALGSCVTTKCASACSQ